MRLLVASLAALTLLALPALAGKPKIRSWACYYGNVFGQEAWGRFDLVVLDGLNHPPLPGTRKNNRPVLLGYISLGEASPSVPWFDAQAPYLVRSNESWGSTVVDPRHPAWRDAILDRAVPEVLARGFDGIFLDTLDSALSLAEGEDAGKYPGVDAAVADLVLAMRRRWPSMPIAVNRGLRLLPELAPHIDYVLVEDLYSLWDEASGSYVRVDGETRATLLDQIARGLDANPGLTVLTLDYADPGGPTDQRDLIREAIAFSRRKGFVPYVSTRLLDQVFYFSLD